MRQQNRVLYRTIFGSRLYGTDLPESDYDYKTIYLPDMAELLIGTQFKNMAVQTDTDLAKAFSMLPSVPFSAQEETIPMSCLLQDFFECQSYALEIVHAVQLNHAFVLKQFSEYGSSHLAGSKELYLKFKSVCDELVAQWKNKDASVMAGYAKAQARKYSIKGDRLNAARAALEWLRDLNSMNGGLYKIGSGFYLSSPAWGRLTQLCSMYPGLIALGEYDITKNSKIMRPCLIILDKVIPFSTSVENALKTVTSAVDSYGARADAASKAEGKDWKALAHAIRIAQEGIDYLCRGSFYFPSEISTGWANTLRSIRKGEVPLETVVEDMERRLKRLMECEAESTWPSKNDLGRADAFRDWMKVAMRDMYALSYVESGEPA